MDTRTVPVVVVLCALTTIVSSSAYPHFIGNDIKLRSNTYSNHGSLYTCYVHREYLTQELEVGAFELHAHYSASLFAWVRRNTRCVKLQIWQNEPKGQPPHRLRWERKVCLEDSNTNVIIHVEPGFYIESDNYVFGWTIDPGNDCPISLDSGDDNGKTWRNVVVNTEPEIGDQVYITQTREDTFSIGVYLYNVTTEETTAEVTSISITEPATTPALTTESQQPTTDAPTSVKDTAITSDSPTFPTTTTDAAIITTIPSQSPTISATTAKATTSSYSTTTDATDAPTLTSEMSTDTTVSGNGSVPSTDSPEQSVPTEDMSTSTISMTTTTSQSSSYSMTTDATNMPTAALTSEMSTDTTGSFPSTDFTEHPTPTEDTTTSTTDIPSISTPIPTIPSDDDSTCVWCIVLGVGAAGAVIGAAVMCWRKRKTPDDKNSKHGDTLENGGDINSNIGKPNIYNGGDLQTNIEASYDRNHNVPIYDNNVKEVDTVSDHEYAIPDIKPEVKANENGTHNGHVNQGLVSEAHELSVSISDENGSKGSSNAVTDAKPDNMADTSVEQKTSSPGDNAQSVDVTKDTDGESDVVCQL